MEEGKLSTRICCFNAHFNRNATIITCNHNINNKNCDNNVFNLKALFRTPKEAVQG